MTKRRKYIFNYFGYIVGGFVLFNITWYILAAWLQLKALPLPTEVYAGYSKAFENGILDHSFASLRRIAYSIGISLGIALVLGLWMGYNKRANKLLGPMIYFSYPIPKLALLPIIMTLFDLGETSKIIIVVLIIVFQLIITIRDAVKNISKESYYVLISFGASSLQKMRHITLPAILPEMFSSLRVALGIATSALFFIETFGTDKGLGFYITDSQMRVDYIQMYFGIIVLSLIGFVLFLIVDLLDNIFCRWKNL
ncbi:MAG: ABC transporter permease [Dysgonomonas sp.]|jgi:NitT/TauT family transport system permease protein|nr:ABC transporter permease [Prevotella sp.]